MKFWMFYLLVVFIFTAPRVSDSVNAFIVSVSFILAIIFALLEIKGTL